MPVKRCVRGGKSGHQYGGQKCYTGSGSKAKAARQGRAIRASQGGKGKK